MKGTKLTLYPDDPIQGGIPGLLFVSQGKLLHIIPETLDEALKIRERLDEVCLALTPKP